MSSNFCRRILLCTLLSWGACVAAAAATGSRFADVVKLPGGDLAMLEGVAVERLALLACRVLA
jgi:hypothetical protein